MNHNKTPIIENSSVGNSNTLNTQKRKKLSAIEQHHCVCGKNQFTATLFYGYTKRISILVKVERTKIYFSNIVKYSWNGLGRIKPLKLSSFVLRLKDMLYKYMSLG